MMSCTDAYRIIQNRLRSCSEPELQEARLVFDAFGKIFVRADNLLSDKELISICKNLSTLHFKGYSPVVTPPWKTIQDEYRKKTGFVIPSYFCILAYSRAAEYGQEIIDADAKQAAAEQAALYRNAQRTGSGTGGGV